MKFEIEKFNACKESIVFRKNYPDFKTAWENCPRGDWMLWIAKKLNVDLLKLTTAKALCANTVRNLMRDERSTKAIDVAILFGQGKASREELDAAAADADDAADAKRKNQQETADICRRILTEDVLAAINNL